MTEPLSDQRREPVDSWYDDALITPRQLGVIRSDLDNAAPRFAAQIVRKLVAEVERLRDERDAATGRAEKAEARVTELEPQLLAYPTPSYPTPWLYQQACEALGAQRVRATEAEAVADELRARFAALGEPEVETRIIHEDGRETEFDLHNEPCGCRREERDVYCGPWRPFEGGAFTPPSRAEIERRAADGAPVHAKWADVKARRNAPPESKGANQ